MMELAQRMNFLCVFLYYVLRMCRSFYRIAHNIINDEDASQLVSIFVLSFYTNNN